MSISFKTKIFRCNGRNIYTRVKYFLPSSLASSISVRFLKVVVAVVNFEQLKFRLVRCDKSIDDLYSENSKIL